MKERKLKPAVRMLIIVLSTLLVYSLAVAALALIYDNRHPEIRVLGEAEVKLEWGNEYIDCGAVAYTTGRLFKGEELEVTQERPADISGLGSYTVTYTAEYKGETVSCSRNITVSDSVSPVINLVPNGSYNFVPELGFQEPGFSAADNYDGDLTAQVQVSIGEDSVLYTVKDSSGNTAVAERELIHAPEQPTIALRGDEKITLEAALTWEDPGVDARDGENRDIGNMVETTLISVDGVDIPENQLGKRVFTPYLPGTYVIRYTAGAEEGLKAETFRTVTVTAKELPKSETPARGTIYLTFDDGPGPYTDKLLAILKYYGVKATFFVTNQFPDYIDLITREYNEGHTVAVHTYEHNYSYIYSGVEAYCRDFMKMSDIIYEKTGNRTNLFRFPGGSSNTVSNYNPGIMTTLSKAMPAMGYKEFDWNVTSGDAGGTKKTSVVVSNVKNGIQEAMNDYGYAVVLQHDIMEYSVNAVEDIIVWARAQGYTFSAIDVTSPRAWHPVSN